MNKEYCPSKITKSRLLNLEYILARLNIKQSFPRRRWYFLKLAINEMNLRMLEWFQDQIIEEGRRYISEVAMTYQQTRVNR